MPLSKFDLTSRGRTRVYLLTVAGTLLCIAVALAFDSYDFENGIWRWGNKPVNDVIIPLILAPPLLFLLLSKLRELAIAQHELLTIASTDSLTSCLNRRAFTAMTEAYLDRVAKNQAQAKAGFLVIDVDRFKQVNDKFGHDCGDEALRLIATTIRGSVRDIDLVGRIGGEEFAVFMPGLSADGAQSIAERIRRAIHTMAFAPVGEPYPLSVSIGGAALNGTASYPELYRQADRHLYAAKQNGRNRVDMETMAPAAAPDPIVLH